MAAGDIIAAFLDLSVASEARIRSCLHAKIPQSMPKGFEKTLRRMNMNDIITGWDDLGFPKVPQLNHIKTLFDIRNRIMHDGREERAKPQCFKKAAEAVQKLLEIL
jgi:hypothetical protein